MQNHAGPSVGCISADFGNNSSSRFHLRARIYTVSQKNDSDVAHYNFNAHQPILVIFGTDIAERTCY